MGTVDDRWLPGVGGRRDRAAEPRGLLGQKNHSAWYSAADACRYTPAETRGALGCTTPGGSPVVGFSY